ncbi:MAG: ATP-binding protein [Gemmatimonadota bacterium]|nr:ATP-binding protein [Gemmatimonadota bacterium]
MRVGTRLAAGTLALIVLFGGILLFYHRVVDRSVETARDLVDVDTHLLLSATSQIELVRQLREDAEKFLITGDPGYFERYVAGRSAVTDSLAVLRALPVAGEPARAVADLSETWAAFERTFPLEARTAGDDGPLFGLSVADWSELRESLARVESGSRRLRTSSIASVTGRVESLSEEADRTRTAGWLALLGALGIGGLLAFLMVRSITAPLGRIERGTAALARGDFSSRVDVRGRNEFAALAARFNEMADRLGELDRAKRDFLARVSHDLKTPLAAIRETQRVLLDGAPGELNPKQRRLTELGLSNAERLATMISRILELSRLEAGVEEYDLDTVDLSALCAETVESFAPHANVSFAGADISAPVRGDREALRRVLENLLDNARSHGGGEAIEVEVVVASGRRGERALVTVRDRGPGIPESEKDAIFRSFSHRRDVQVARGHVGLGLAICREIVAAHDGEIWVENAREGGSVFGFSLPIVSTPGTAEPKVGEPGAERKGSRAAIPAAMTLVLALAGCASGRPPPPEIESPPVPLLATEELAPRLEPELPVPHPFDILFEAGDWEEAAVVFARDSTLHGRERALFRSTLIHAMPDRPTFSPALVREGSERLAELYPGSPYLAVTDVVLGLVGRLEGSTATMAALQRQLERLKAVDLEDPPPE